MCDILLHQFDFQISRITAHKESNIIRVFMKVHNFIITKDRSPFTCSEKPLLPNSHTKLCGNGRFITYAFFYCVCIALFESNSTIKVCNKCCVSGIIFAIQERRMWNKAATCLSLIALWRWSVCTACVRYSASQLLQWRQRAGGSRVHQK